MKTKKIILFPLKKGIDSVVCTGFLLFSIIILGACSSDDPDSPNKKSSDKKSSLTVTITENFSDPLKNPNNIMVGDFLRYDINVESQKENASYVFNLNNSYEKGHRRLKKDYEAFFLSKEMFDKYQKEGFYETGHILSTKYKKWLKQSEVTSSIINIDKKGKYILLLRPLLAGTFTHTYSFYEKGAETEIPHQAIEKQVNFNCVDLSAWVQPVRTRDGSSGVLGIFSHASEHHNEYYIRIYDGANENDKYLVSQEDRTQTYEIKYDGNVYKGTLSEGTDIRFIKGKTYERNAPEVKNRIIDKITIYQKDKGRDEVVIEFYNIPLTIKSEIRG